MRNAVVRRVLASVVVLGLVVSLAWAQADENKPFVGNRVTKKFHTRECGYGKRIAPKNRVYFDTAEEAEKAGYVACKVCNPKDKKEAERPE